MAHEEGDAAARSAGAVAAAVHLKLYIYPHFGPPTRTFGLLK